MNDIENWLNTLKLSEEERTATSQFFQEAGFTLSDLLEFDDDFAKEFITKEKIAHARDATIFRIRRGIKALKQAQHQQPSPSTQDFSPSAGPSNDGVALMLSNGSMQPETQPIQEPVPMESSSPQFGGEEENMETKDAEEESTDWRSWTTEQMCSHIRSSPILSTIKPTTLNSIISVFQQIPLDGPTVASSNVLKDYESNFKGISLGGRHKLRKVLRNLENGAPPPPPAATQEANKPSFQPPPSAQPSVLSPVIQQPQQKLKTPPPSNPIPIVQQQQQPPPPSMAPMSSVPSMMPSFASNAPSLQSAQVATEEKQPHLSSVPPSLSSSLSSSPSLLSSSASSVSSFAPSSSAPMLSPKRQWYWWDDTCMWYPYEPDTNEEIENAWNKKEAEVALTRGTYFSGRPGQYMVKFDHKEKLFNQINTATQEHRSVMPSDADSFREFSRNNRECVSDRPKTGGAAPIMGGGAAPFPGFAPMGGFANPMPQMHQYQPQNGFNNGFPGFHG